MRATLYPIYAVSDMWQDDPFDHTMLPAQVVPGVTIENVKAMFNEETFSWVSSSMGTHDLETLTGVKYAIVHRFDEKLLDHGANDQTSASLVSSIAACLRLIRPMRQFASRMVGNLRPDGTIDIQTFEHPVKLIDVPQVQKGFSLRNNDVVELQSIVKEFQRAMSGEYWKFKMSVSFHDSGQFAVSFWKSRFMLWCSAVEALFTSQNRNHQGSLVATERIKWFLGANTSIFAPGDIQSFMPQENYTVAEIVDDLYEVRNCIAHGERIPDRLFEMIPAGYFGESGNILTMLQDGLSFIVRTSLRRILKDNLLHHFVDGPSAEKYFGAAGLTKSELLRAKQQKRP